MESVSGLDSLKTIGILGGMSWQSTLLYYSIINSEVSKIYGGLSSAKCLIHSFNLAELKPLQKADNWKEIAKILSERASALEKAGADCLILATNTMHLVADQIQEEISIPMIHIVDSVGREAVKLGFKKVGLLGTKFTMEKDFYKNSLSEKYGIQTLIPDENERQQIHSIIFTELCLGKVETESVEFYQRVIENLKNQGAQAVILGCTEIPLLFKDHKSALPILDSTKLHALATTRFAASL